MISQDVMIRPSVIAGLDLMTRLIVMALLDVLERKLLMENKGSPTDYVDDYTG